MGPCSGRPKGSPGGSRCGSLRSSCGRKAALLRKFFLRRRRRGLKRVRRLCLQERPRRGALLGLERRAGAGGDTVGAPVFLLQITICHDSLLTHEIAERFCSDSKRIPEWIPGLGGGKRPGGSKTKKLPAGSTETVHLRGACLGGAEQNCGKLLVVEVGDALHDAD